MAEELSWTRDGERLTLLGELDQDFLVPLWDARNEATQGVSVIDLNGLSRVDTAGLALLVHLVDLIHAKGRKVRLEGVSEKVATLKRLYNLPEGMIP
ncbi:lipid asymmetry maintenance protein MlaB [Kluyvera sp. CRP]|uniref:lipid asymmetry maintenance protein MlaB n=1 Tax=Kluyvera sp. CRP TaxID=2873269 RepID=UPI001CC1CAA7|nr:lipid asymmetry maintenance protein MlaB [Kluyvera sp. CRP]UAK21791.1 lipid asymmetry maintenance protein MlaB [Kluyvera sp. CRP]